MIGHIQRNKARDVVRLFSYVHAVDSVRLLEALDAAAAEAGKTLPVLLEVNVSGEGSKFGLAPDEVPAALERCASLMNLDVSGLMTIPPFTPETEAARPHFARLRALRDTWREATGFPLDELSMGMSHDFEVAIEEGATWIRLGTILFGDRE
jgi:pyridoxal phosphate enzyme (YggS family)